MKITIKEKIVTFVPENDQEAADLDMVWKNIIDCNAFNKKLAPMGAYLPGEGEGARFVIED